MLLLRFLVLLTLVLTAPADAQRKHNPRAMANPTLTSGGLPSTPAECDSMSPVSGAQDPLLTCQTQSALNAATAAAQAQMSGDIPRAECYNDINTCFPLYASVGDITPNSGGSFTDVNGDVWSLLSGLHLNSTCAGGPSQWWYGATIKNGVNLGYQNQDVCYGWTLRRLANGHVYYQSAKEGGAWDLTAGQGGPDGRGNPGLATNPGGLAGCALTSNCSHRQQTPARDLSRLPRQ